ncbi:MAG: hypothetical protein ACR2GX_02570 [Candidatus Dormibacteria bacterium]
MDLTVVTYLVYLTISIGLTVWVGHTLYANGGYFLVDIFGGDETLAGAVNRLLIVGFYLVNLGFVALNLRADPVASASGTIETLAAKLGFVLLALGAMHFFNLVVLNKVRHSKLHPRPPAPAQPTLPPLSPAGYAGSPRAW